MLKLKSKFILPIILGIVFLVYSNSLQNLLVWDDHLFLEQWPQITSLNNIGEIIQGSAPAGQDKIFRPLRGVIYALDYHFFKANPFFYHLQAVVIHLFSTALVYLINLKILRNIKLSAFSLQLSASITALVFGLHPIHTETINYISASLETFGSLFFFASFYLYLKASQKGVALRSLLFTISLVLAAAAFFTYEMTLTLPLVILLYEFCFKVKSLRSLKLLKILAPYFLLAAAFVFIRVFIFHITSRTDYLGYSFFLTMLMMVKVIVRYIGLLLLPINQTPIHDLVGDFPSSMIPYDKLDPILNQSVFDPGVLLSLGILGGLGWLGIKLRKKTSLITFCISWFFITLLPVSYIIPHGGAMAEKYLYIASFGFCLLFAWGLIKLVQSSKFKVQSFNIFLIFTLCILIFYSYQTFKRNQVWHDDITLFQDVVAKSPNNLIANYTLGIWYGREGDLGNAQKHYSIALKKAPEFWEARYNLANTYLKQNKINEAIKEYQQISDPEKKFVKNILENLGRVKLNQALVINTSNNMLINHKTSTSLSFDYPVTWKLSENKSEIVLVDPDDKINIQIAEGRTSLGPEAYVKTQEEDQGDLVNQGLAKIPNFETSFVKVFNRDGKQQLHFFLFKEQRVVKLIVDSIDGSIMNQFDSFLESLKYVK